MKQEVFILWCPVPEVQLIKDLLTSIASMKEMCIPYHVFFRIMLCHKHFD